MFCIGVFKVSEYICRIFEINMAEKVFDVNNSNPWKILLIDEIESYGGEKFWSLTKEGLKTKSFSNPFWQNILEIRSSIQQNPATTHGEILSQPIWYNKNIKIANKSVFFKQWCSHGI